MNQSATPCRIAVVGAGVVGMTTAQALQKRGFAVTVVDAREPGMGASYGNAGFLATELVEPLSTVKTLCKAPPLWFDPHGALALPLRYLPRLLPWLVRFIAAARPNRVHKSRVALAALNQAAVPAWQRCLARIGAEDELLPSGYLLVWESVRKREAAKRHQQYLRQWNIDAQWLEGQPLRDHEPGLSEAVSHGLLLPGAHQVRDPHVLVQRLAHAFLDQGGEIRQATVQRLSPGQNQVTLATEKGELNVDKVVVAAGAWSHILAEHLGLEIPLETERGYHLTMPDQGNALRQPVGSAERNVVMTPMSCGLRIVGFSELGGLSLAPIHRRFITLKHHAESLLKDSSSLDDSAREWMGFRPTLPDSLPVIDRHPVYPMVHFAFGHQHLGLTQAAITAELIEALVCDETPAIDLAPYRITRFMKGKKSPRSITDHTSDQMKTS